MTENDHSEINIVASEEEDKIITTNPDQLLEIEKKKKKQTKKTKQKEVYDRAVKHSSICWHDECLSAEERLADCHAVLIEEKKKRIEAEEKYERLTRKLKEIALKEVNEREVSFEEGKVYPARDYGAGLIPVQHILKK